MHLPPRLPPQHLHQLLPRLQRRLLPWPLVESEDNVLVLAQALAWPFRTELLSPVAARASAPPRTWASSPLSTIGRTRRRAPVTPPERSYLHGQTPLVEA